MGIQGIGGEQGDMQNALDAYLNSHANGRIEVEEVDPEHAGFNENQVNSNELG